MDEDFIESDSEGKRTPKKKTNNLRYDLEGRWDEKGDSEKVGPEEEGSN